jgi:hypothetical protein
MKTKTIAALIVLTAFSSALTNDFPEVGKSYSVDYAVSSDSNPPREFKIISKGPDSWYFIEYIHQPMRLSKQPGPTSPPTAVRMWINFAHIVTAKER